MRSIPSFWSARPEFLPSGVSANPGPPTEWPITIRTPDAQWAYAARFARGTRTTDEYTGPIAVRFLVQVTDGAVGFGCLDASRTGFIDEIQVAPAAAACVVELVVASPQTADALIVRNVSAAGSSEVRLHEVGCFAIDVDPGRDREPALSDPFPMPGWERYYGTEGESALEKIRVQMFRALGAPTVLRWIDGLQIRVFPGDQLSRVLFLSSTYEPNTACVLRRLLRRGDTFLDVGANAGVVSVMAARWVGTEGRVYSFEPSRREYERLVDNLTLNGLLNVVPVRAAVSRGAGAAVLRVAGDGHGGLNTLGEGFAYDGVEVMALEEVETVGLDSFVEQEVGRVSVVKVDVEGAEGEVLAGSQRLLTEHRPALVLEINQRALAANKWTVAEVEGVLRRVSYRVFAISDDSVALTPLAQLSGVDGQNIVALPNV